MGSAFAQGHGPAEAFPCPTLRGAVHADGSLLLGRNNGNPTMSSSCLASSCAWRSVPYTIDAGILFEALP